MVVRENAGESVDSARLLRAGRCGEAAAGGVRGFPAGPLVAEVLPQDVALGQHRRRSPIEHQRLRVERHA